MEGRWEDNGDEPAGRDEREEEATYAVVEADPGAVVIHIGGEQHWIT